jgi:predicted LPLAT superfamily acyltransferase
MKRAARYAAAVGLALGAFYFGRSVGQFETVRALAETLHYLERAVCTKRT